MFGINKIIFKSNVLFIIALKKIEFSIKFYQKEMEKVSFWFNTLNIICHVAFTLYNFTVLFFHPQWCMRDYRDLWKLLIAIFYGFSIVDIKETIKL